MKLKYTIIFLIMIISLNGVFANCIIGFPNDSPFAGKTSCICNEETKICDCRFTSNIEVNTDTTVNPLYIPNPSCNNFIINFYTNGYDLLLEKNFTFLPGSSNILRNSNVISNLIINASSNINIGDDSNIIELPNIIVNSGKKLQIITVGYFQTQKNSYDIKIESIFVNQNSIADIKISSNPGKPTIADAIAGQNDWLTAGDSGDLNFKIIDLKNFGKITIDLQTGTGGKGANGDGTDNSDFIDNDSPDMGDHAGNSGSIDFNITNIENNNLLNINLKTGDGGTGGNSVVDRCVGSAIDEPIHGGNGGNAGDIKTSKIEQIRNFGELNLEISGGNGGYAGSQRVEQDWACGFGHNGSGGNGGSISDLNIGILQNKLSDSIFNLKINSGALGKVTLLSDSCADDPRNDGGRENTSFGLPGNIGNINIDFVENNSANGFEITSNFNFTPADYDLAIVATNNGGIDGADNGSDMQSIELLNSYLKLSNITINYLNNGSYLPKNISAYTAIDNYSFFNNDIRINGCYINPTAVNYNIKDDTIIGATNPDAISVVNSNFDLTYRFCPHCEVIRFEDDQSRYTKQYNLYSNINGTINPGDLNIYYSDYNSQPNSIYYTKRTDGQFLPVYTNKNSISGVFNTKVNSYEYLITPEDLNRYSYDPEEDRDNLNPEADDYLFCYGEEYILDGKITTIQGGDKSFNFPFVPLREQFNN